jgi:hypothetical protein
VEKIETPDLGSLLQTIFQGLGIPTTDSQRDELTGCVKGLM